MYLDTQQRSGVVMHHLFGLQLLCVYITVFLACCCVCVCLAEHTGLHRMSVRKKCFKKSA